MNDDQRVEYLQYIIGIRWKAATRALFKVFENQTESEKKERTVKHHNGIGFVPQDADFLTGLVRHWQAKGTYTDRQKKALMDIMPKYARQILKTKCNKEDVDRLIKRDGFVA